MDSRLLSGYLGPSSERDEIPAFAGMTKARDSTACRDATNRVVRAAAWGSGSPGPTTSSRRMPGSRPGWTRSDRLEGPPGGGVPGSALDIPERTAARPVRLSRRSAKPHRRSMFAPIGSLPPRVTTTHASSRFGALRARLGHRLAGRLPAAHPDVTVQGPARAACPPVPSLFAVPPASSRCGVRPA